MPTNDCLETIFSRKSVRNYKSDLSVSHEQIELLLRAGMAAATAVNKQPWEFLVVENRQILDYLAQELPYAKMLKQTPAAIIVLANINRAHAGYDEYYWLQDCCAATQNILLAAESIGLGAVWTAVFPREDRIFTVKTTFNLPENMMPVNVIPIGIPAGTDQPKDKWKPNYIHWDNYTTS